MHELHGDAYASNQALAQLPCQLMPKFAHSISRRPRKLGKDHKVVVLPLGGNQLAKGGVEIELGEIKRLSTHVFALVDSERDTADSAPKVERSQFEALCHGLGFDVCVTERRSIENYFTDSAVKAVKGEKYVALGHYQRLGEVPLGWSKGENWRIAREMNIADLANTDLGKFFARI